MRSVMFSGCIGWRTLAIKVACLSTIFHDASRLSFYVLQTRALLRSSCETWQERVGLGDRMYEVRLILGEVLHGHLIQFWYRYTVLIV